MRLSPPLKSLSTALEVLGAMHIFNKYLMHLTFPNSYCLSWLQRENHMKENNGRFWGKCLKFSWEPTEKLWIGNCLCQASNQWASLPFLGPSRILKLFRCWFKGRREVKWAVSSCTGGRWGLTLSGTYASWNKTNSLTYSHLTWRWK